MADGPLISVVRHIRKMAGRNESTALDDGRLLERFITHRDEAAFETLLRRHGPMVHSVCRRVLYDPQDAEDAFQATFLVLIRKAGSLGRRDLLAQWLYGVAYRTALKARANRKRASARGLSEAGLAGPDGSEERTWRDLRPVIDEELNRLPAKYRVPVVLCYLEGKTFAEAARHLGWPEGTVSGRLYRARELLRKRLTRRGITLSATMLGTFLSEQTLSAVPAVLGVSTVKVGLIVASKKIGTAGPISASVITLMEGVLRAMFVTKLKIATALFTLALLGTGTGMLTYHKLAAQSPAEQKTAAPQAPIAEGSRPNPPPRSVFGEMLYFLSEETVKAYVAERTDLSDNLKDLLQQRYKAASIAMESRLREFEAGRGTIDMVIEMTNNLYRAQRELSVKKPNQTAALENRLALLRAVEELTKARFYAGRIPVHDMALATFNRLDVEIALERTKSQP